MTRKLAISLCKTTVTFCHMYFCVQYCCCTQDSCICHFSCSSLSS